MASSSHFRYPYIPPSQSSSLPFSSGTTSSHSRSSSGSSSNRRNNNIQLHPYLRKNQEVVAHGIRSYILWDIREHPRNAQQVLKLPLLLPPDVLNTCATNPPVASLYVACDYPKPWGTVVHASTGPYRAQGAGVTIADLLVAIYNHIHSHSISISEFNTLQTRQQTRILEAYEKRRLMSQLNPSTSPIRTNKSSTAGEAVKLVDTFLLHTLFAGMEIDPNNGSTVILSVKRPN